MKVYPHIQKKHILLNVRLKDKEAVLRFAADAFARDRIVENAGSLCESMEQREKTMSTGIGNGIGIPHAASAEAQSPAVLLIRLAEPIDFESLDGLPVDIILALVVPEKQTSLHLQILAGISRLCEKTKFLDLVRNAQDPDGLLEEIKQLEQEIAFH